MKATPADIEIWRRKLVNLKQAWIDFSKNELHPTSLPYRLSIELTQNCNFRCRMCAQSFLPKFAAYRSEYNMPMELFEKIAEEAFPLATTVDMRGFGETTHLPYWGEVVDYLKKFPYINWHLITNLSMKKAAVWEKMIKLGFEIGFSCDGGTKRTFEYIRRHGKFDQVLTNLEVISDAIRKHKKGYFYFLTTVQDRNVAELSAIIKLAARFGFKEVQFKAAMGTAQTPLYALSRAKVKSYITKAVECATEHDVSISFNDPFFTRDVAKTKLKKIPPHPGIQGNFGSWPPPSVEVWDELQMGPIFTAALDSTRVSVHQKCYKPMSFTHFDYKGGVGTCNHTMYPQPMVMGNIREKSLREIWLGEKYVDFRRQLLTATPQDKRCQWCFKHRLTD